MEIYITLKLLQPDKQYDKRKETHNYNNFWMNTKKSFMTKQIDLHKVSTQFRHTRQSFII